MVGLKMGWRRPYSSVNYQQIDIQVVGFLAHVLDEAHKVTPVSPVVLLADMTFKPVESSLVSIKPSGNGGGHQPSVSICGIFY